VLGRQPAGPLLDQLDERAGVRAGPAGQLVRRGGQVRAHDEQAAVVLRQHDRGVGRGVPQAVRGQQAELVVGQQRVGLDQHVRAGAGVVAKPGRVSSSVTGVAADHLARLEHADLEPRRGQVCRADQPVVPGTDHDDIGAVRQRRHGASRWLQSIAALCRRNSTRHKPEP
jgi:hypothetical protein